MTWWERWGFNTFYGVVTLTGVAYFYMKNVMVTDDPFAVVNHPWESTMLLLHLIAAPFLIAFFGMIFRSHSLLKILSPSPVNRRTGWTSFISFSTMVVSGYFIQVAATSMLLSVAIWTHIITSTVFVIGYTIHLIIGYRVNRLFCRQVLAARPDIVPSDSVHL